MFGKETYVICDWFANTPLLIPITGVVVPGTTLGITNNDGGALVKPVTLPDPSYVR